MWEVIDLVIRNTSSVRQQDRTELDYRKRLLQRKEAATSYKKQNDFFQPRSQSVKELEDLLIGKKELEQQVPTKSTITQVKDVESRSITGKNTLETVELLREVRRVALSAKNPTEQDHRVAHVAEKSIETFSEEKVATIQDVSEQPSQAEELKKNTTIPIVSAEERAQIRKQRYISKALEKYSFQVQMKEAGFQLKQSSFSIVA